MGKSQKNYMSIKSKLMAAVAMLLVASFMVVSSTYAWFTLSTAPEIKGITTTIGANGNLEIALAYGKTGAEFDKNDVGSGVGTSGDYTTWGNLIDASGEKYGMDQITLLPSRLNITTTDGALGAAPLSTPIYGSDGRIDSLVSETYYGAYDSNNKQFLVDGAASGLVAIGTASGMTPQQTGYRNEKAAFTTNLSSAQLKASGSLNKYGSDLANNLVDLALKADDPEARYDVSAIEGIYTELMASAGLIETAIRNYFGVWAAKATESSDANYTIASAIAKNADLADLITGGDITVAEGTYNFPAVSADAPVAKAYAKLVKIKDVLAAVDTAKKAATALNAATEAEVRAILFGSGLIVQDKVTVAGLKISEVKANVGTIATAVMNSNLVVAIADDGGVYADIAAITGNYRSGIIIESVKYGEWEFENVPATMATEATVLDMKGTLPTAPASTSTENAAITDFYGYAVDLVFRTNASGSNLMLQTTPTQRIYSDSTNLETLGSGSTMTFNPTTADFTSEQVAALMSAIRIVFTTKDVVTTTTGEGENAATTTETTTKIVAIAGLDVENATQTAEGGYTASIMLLNWKIVEETEGEGEGATTYNAIQITEGENGSIFKGNDSTKDTVDKPDFAQKLIALNKNEATVLSALVYLDGDLVDNTMVAATAENSMTGSMNLQFSSDAELKPMMNTPIYDGNEGGGETPAESN